MGIVTALFGISLIPQIYQNYYTKSCKINLFTIVVTFLGVMTIAICSYSLGLMYFGFMNTFTAILWYVIGCQKIDYEY